MAKKIAIGVLVCIGLGALFSLWTTSVPLFELLKQPLQSIVGSGQNIETGVLEVSGNMETVEEATRRLLKPFGVVRLIRRFPGSSSADSSSSNSK